MQISKIYNIYKILYFGKESIYRKSKAGADSVGDISSY